MKKQLLIGAMLMGTVFTTNAQEIFNVDFSDTTVLEDWFLIDADGDGAGFTIEDLAEYTDDLGFEGETLISASFDNTVGPLTPDNSLISESFEVPADGATFTFQVGGIDPEFFSEHYAVYVVASEDFDPIFEGLISDPQTATVEDYTALLTDAILEETVESVEATEKTATISSDFAGQEVRLVVRHFEVTDQFLLVMDSFVVTEGSTAGVNNPLASKFSVFPNPANNVVNIANAENILVNGVTIADINGRTVKSAKFDNVAEAQINIADLASGVYMMTVSSDKGTTTKKIVKN